MPLAGNITIVGDTSSSNFPTASAFQPAYAGGGLDAFVSRISSGGKSLVYSTYLGSTGQETAWGLALDDAGNIYVTGRTASANFPTGNPLRSTYAGAGDAFLTKLGATGSLAYSTYLGGAGNDRGNAVCVANSPGKATSKRGGPPARNACDSRRLECLGGFLQRCPKPARDTPRSGPHAARKISR
jgi:hypothetical protein